MTFQQVKNKKIKVKNDLIKFDHLCILLQHLFLNLEILPLLHISRLFVKAGRSFRFKIYFRFCVFLIPVVEFAVRH